MSCIILSLALPLLSDYGTQIYSLVQSRSLGSLILPPRPQTKAGLDLQPYLHLPLSPSLLLHSLLGRFFPKLTPSMNQGDSTLGQALFLRGPSNTCHKNISKTLWGEIHRKDTKLSYLWIHDLSSAYSHDAASWHDTIVEKIQSRRQKSLPRLLQVFMCNSLPQTDILFDSVDHNNITWSSSPFNFLSSHQRASQCLSLKIP